MCLIYKLNLELYFFYSQDFLFFLFSNVFHYFHIFSVQIMYNV